MPRSKDGYRKPGEIAKDLLAAERDAGVLRGEDKERARVEAIADKLKARRWVPPEKT